jgi:glucose/arabinose dehydrogenase
MTRVVRYGPADSNGNFGEKEVVIPDLPEGHHRTRTILFSPDYSILYVSIGSSCNLCIEEDERRAAILRYNPDGSDIQLFARGLRNAVGIMFRPGTEELWAANNGTDLMGDDLPPETIYRLEGGQDYGWPRCHAGRIEDPELGQRGSCNGVPRAEVEITAHSAPLGLAFYSGEAFPEEYRGDLFVALHGSWNRSTPVGYKVVRIPMDGGRPGPVEDFASGWLRKNGQAWGRPVAVITGADGSLFVSDDAGGRIYRIFYLGE